jgi:hypothetical protein
MVSYYLLLVLLKTYGASCTHTYTTQQCDYSIGLTCSLVSAGCNCPTTSVANMCDCQASNLNSLFNFCGQIKLYFNQQSRLLLEWISMRY